MKRQKEQYAIYFQTTDSQICVFGLFLSTTSLYAQERVFTLSELFTLADKNSKSIRFHQLLIQEAEQGIKVAAMPTYLHSVSKQKHRTSVTAA